MGQVLVRKIPDLVRVWKKRAKSRGRSLESEIRQSIVESAPRDRSEFIAFANRIRKQLHGKYTSDGTALIREDRDR